MVKGQPWYKAKPFLCAALARHIYHCLKYEDPYDVETAFQGHSLQPAEMHVLNDVQEEVDRRFEAMEADSSANVRLRTRWNTLRVEPDRGCCGKSERE